MSFAPDGIQKTYFVITGTRNGKAFKENAVAVQGLETVEKMREHFARFPVYPGVTDLKVELVSDQQAVAANQPQSVTDTLSMVGGK